VMGPASVPLKIKSDVQVDVDGERWRKDLDVRSATENLVGFC
jgi:hypothetical protein